MKLIRGIKISGFRSIREAELGSLGSLTALVGKNSCGKSNVLRALNLFFNDLVEGSKPVSFLRDHHDRPHSRRKKRISVSVDFQLPDYFKYRKQLDQLKALGPNFTITRSWELDERREPFDTYSATSEGRPVVNGPDLARQFVSLVAYRYVPNRSIPSQLLQDESQAIADSIFLRMKGDQHAAALLNSLSAAANRMLAPASRSLELTGSPLSTPSVATASTLGEMITMSGFQATAPHGVAVQDEDWGAGHQAFFLYLVLHMLDTNYGRFFGWRQATIWGIEEPESGLHRDLETRLAEKVREWAEDDESRLQIIETTHSPVFTMAADAGYWTDLDGAETQLHGMRIPELTRAAELRGVSGWVHPILSFPWNPVVLVEGSIDADVLYHVAALAGLDSLRFLTLPGLDDVEKGAGKDPIILYLKRHSGLISNRPRESPLIVLFDWDVSEQQLKMARDAYGPSAADRVLRMDDAYCDPALGIDFRGIERFYPPSAVLASHNHDECTIGIPKKQGKPYTISKAELSKAKNRLAMRLKQQTDLQELTPLVRVLKDIERAVLAGRPTQQELPGL